MAWIDDLLPASINGKPFAVARQDTEHGRRGVSYEYATRDEPGNRDLGRKARGYRFEGFVVGDNYLLDAQAIVAEVEKPAPHKLVHPSHGAVPVRVVSLRVSEDLTGALGMARLSFDCEQWGEYSPPRRLIPTVSTAADLAAAAISASFGKKFSLLELAGDLAQKGLAALQDANRALGKAAGKIASALGVVDSFAAEIDAFDRNIQTLANTPTALAGAFINLGVQILGLVDTVAGLAPSFSDGAPGLPTPHTDTVLREAAALAAFAAEGDRSDATPQRRQDAANLDAVNELTRTAGTIAAARTLGPADYSGSADALRARDKLVELIDAASGTDDDGLFDALQTLRGAVQKQLNEQAQALPRVAVVTPEQTTNALVLAWEIYGDAYREAEIAARNGIADPSTVPGGTAIEVVRDA